MYDLNEGLVGMRISMSVHSEEVLKKIMKKHSLTNFSEAIEHLCANYELKDK